MIDVSPDERDKIFNLAQSFTKNGQDPKAVIKNATPLLEWLAGAAHTSEANARLRALTHQATALRRGAGQDDLDNPMRFLDQAKVYYKFING